MNLTIPYGETTLTAEAPDRTFVLPSDGATTTPESLADLDAAIRNALATPLGAPRLRELAKPGAKVLIAFDDGTVTCFGPYRRLAIEAVLDELTAAGVARETVKLVCANSLHRQFTRDELAILIGQDLVDEFGERLTCHDAEDAENLVHFGTTADHGYDVEVSRDCAEADLTIYITSAYGRGFSGGWKSVCVGLSTFRSIRHHHTPDGMSMSTKNNRMHAVLDEMGAHLESKLPGKIYKVDAIETDAFNKSHVFAGSVCDCRKAAIDVLVDRYPPRRDLSDAKYDAILYGVPDWSPYAIFSHMNPILTLISSGLGYLGGTVQALGKPGCTVIMATPCPLRWDHSRHPSYADVWENVLPKERDPYRIEAEYTEHYATHPKYIEQYRHGYAFHPVHGILATHPLKRLRHAGRVIVAGIEDPAVAAHIGFEAAGSVEEALLMAAATHGPAYTLAYAQHPATQTKLAM